MKKKKTMNIISGTAFLVIGGLLILWGYNESQSLGSHLNRLFSGNPSEHVLFYYIGGGVCILLGLVNITRR